MSLSVQYVKPLRDKKQGAMAERDWRVATDLPGRLVELRETLGDSIPEFTRRFCRTRKQWYQWKEGTQLPGRTLLQTTAENYEWSLEIFTEGGRRPKELVNSPVNARQTVGLGKVGAARLAVSHRASGRDVLGLAQNALAMLNQVVQLLEADASRQELATDVDEAADAGPMVDDVVGKPEKPEAPKAGDGEGGQQAG